MKLPATETVTEWGGGQKPAARVRCITCGSEYLTGLDYDVSAPCWFCRSPILKAVFQPCREPDDG